MSNPISISPSERRALQALVEYGTCRDAALAIHVSKHTLETHIKHLRTRTGLRYACQLVAWAVVSGEVTPPAWMVALEAAKGTDAKITSIK